jgi:hypothetical protein
VVIDGSAGEIHIRKNGNSSDDFSATGLNTRGGTSNNYANKVALVSVGNAVGGNVFVDDLWLYDGNTGGLPHDFIGDVRAVQIMPNADTAQKNFAANLATSQLGTSVQSGSNTFSIALNTAYTTAVHAPVGGGTFTSATVNLNAGFTGHMTCGVYDSDGAAGAPGTLLASSNPVTNPVTGVNSFTFSSPPALQNGHKYYLALLSDTSCVAKAGVAASGHWSVAQSYGSGLPLSFGGTSGTTNEILEYIAITVTNSGSVNESVEDGAATIVTDSNPGD